MASFPSPPKKSSSNPASRCSVGDGNSGAPTTSPAAGVTATVERPDKTLGDRLTVRRAIRPQC